MKTLTRDAHIRYRRHDKSGVTRSKRARAGVWMLCLLIMTGVLVSSDTSATSASTRYRRSARQIAPGIKLIRILDRRGPNRIKVLSIDPASRMTIDAVLSNNLLTGFEKTSSMARRRGAIAAINGDYALPWGRPPHVFAADGDLKGTPVLRGRAFAISRDETHAHFGHPSVLVSVANAPTGVEDWRVQLWNERVPRGREIAAYTPAAGGHLRPPRSACSARLYRASRMRWGSDSGTGVVRDYRIDGARCSNQRMRLKRGIVLSARRRSARAHFIKELRRGDVVALKWSLGWRGVLDAIGGNPTLFENGRNTIGECPRSAYFCRRHPRTGVGVKPNGRILFVVVDGRRPRYSIGMRPYQFARLFKHLGATSALNLDGGGSTTMVVRDRVINRPTDPGGERGVSSALVVFRGRDLREREPAPFLSSTGFTQSGDAGTLSASAPNVLSRADASAAAASARRTSLDPASMGGLLDALSKGAFGNRSVELSPGLQRIVTRFRGAR
jgi:hypothetical protein